MIDTIHMGTVVEVAVKTLLASGLTLGVLRLMANRTAAERSFVAHLGLAATLAIPFAALILPALTLGERFDWLSGIVAPSWLYVVPAVLLGGVTAIAVGRLFGLRNRATVLVEPAWLGALAHAQRRMDFKSGAALLVSPDITSPVSWGLFRPTIVLDERALQAKGEAEAIIAHELAHVARADWAKLLLSRAATALFWFNPLVWLLARQCHELREEAADDAVLRHEVDGSDYAAILVGHARHECRGLLLAANGVAPGRGSLRRRVTRVLDAKLRRAPAGMGFVATVMIVALVAGTPLAALTLRAPRVPAAPVVPRAAVAPKRVVTTVTNTTTKYVQVPATPVTLPPAVPAPVTSPLPPAVPQTTSAQVFADATARLVQETVGRAEVKRAMAEAARAKAYAVSARAYAAGDLIAMSTQGVTPGWLQEMAALGYRNLTTDQVMSLAVQGIGPKYVREMAAAGYRNLTVDQLVAMRIQGVTPDFARAAIAASGSKPSVDWLVAMRMGGLPRGSYRATPAVPVRVKVPVRAPAPPRPPADPDDE
jgi:bla regulator protein BlaR1